MSFDFLAKGRDVEVHCTVVYDVEAQERFIAEKLGHLTVILPYPFAKVRIHTLPGTPENYITLLDRGDETEVRVLLGGLHDSPLQPSDLYGFTLEYTLEGLVEDSLLFIPPSIKHILTVQSPYLVDFASIMVRVLTSISPRETLISSNLHSRADIYTPFPARYTSPVTLSGSFSNVSHGSMNVSIEWRTLNPFEMYLIGLWGTVFFLPIYFVLSLLVFQIQRVSSPSLIVEGYTGFLCAFLAYTLILPIVYWSTMPILFTFGQFFHIPLAYYLPKRILKKSESIEVALRISVYTSFILLWPYVFLYSWYLRG
jgi:hypothetical protein